MLHRERVAETQNEVQTNPPQLILEFLEVGTRPLPETEPLAVLPPGMVRSMNVIPGVCKPP